MRSSIIIETTKPPSAANTRRPLIHSTANHAEGELMKSLPANGNRFFDMSRVTRRDLSLICPLGTVALCNVTSALQAGGVA